MTSKCIKEKRKENNNLYIRKFVVHILKTKQRKIKILFILGVFFLNLGIFLIYYLFAPRPFLTAWTFHVSSSVDMRSKENLSKTWHIFMITFIANIEPCFLLDIQAERARKDKDNRGNNNHYYRKGQNVEFFNCIE